MTCRVVLMGAQRIANGSTFLKSVVAWNDRVLRKVRIYPDDCVRQCFCVFKDLCSLETTTMPCLLLHTHSNAPFLLLLLLLVYVCSVLVGP